MRMGGSSARVAASSGRKEDPCAWGGIAWIKGAHTPFDEGDIDILNRPIKVSSGYVIVL